MLVVNAFTLAGVDLFDLADDVAMHRLATHDFVEFAQIDMPIAQYRADRNEIAFLHLESDIRRNGIFVRLLVAPVHEDFGRLTSVLSLIHILKALTTSTSKSSSVR